MGKIEKMLVFRNKRYNYGTKVIVAKRNKVVYEVVRSIWHDGKLIVEQGGLPYHVRRFDIVANDLIDTVNVRRFASEEEARQFCQDMREGKIDLDVLRMEVRTDFEDRNRKENEIAQSDADKFKGLLNKKGITFADFNEIGDLWRSLDINSQRLVYSEGEIDKSEV